MEISLSRFVQLTALLAAGGALATACTVNQTKDQSSQGGAGGAVSASTGGATGVGGNSGGGASGLATGGTTGNSTSMGGGTSTAGAMGIGGATGSVGGATGNLGGSTASAGGASGGTTTGVGDAGGSTASTGGASATGGKSGTGGAAGTFAGAGGIAATGGSSAATGGTTSLTCVSGDPAAESLGFDCSKLSYYSEQCDPTGEGMAQDTYGVSMCGRYASERVDSVKIFTDCLMSLTAPSNGWCGAEHKTAVDACRAQMLTRTCPSSAAQSACTAIHATCSAVTVANCVADLSPLGDAEITDSIEPCMEGAGLLSSICEYTYRSCARYPALTVSVTDSCNQLILGCSGINLQTCEGLLDFYGSGIILESTFKETYVGCMQAEQDAGSTCLEALHSWAGQLGGLK